MASKNIKEKIKMIAVTTHDRRWLLSNKQRVVPTDGGGLQTRMQTMDQSPVLESCQENVHRLSRCSGQSLEAMNITLSDKRVLITGAGRGIGQRIWKP